MLTLGVAPDLVVGAFERRYVHLLDSLHGNERARTSASGVTIATCASYAAVRVAAAES